MGWTKDNHWTPSPAPTKASLMLLGKPGTEKVLGRRRSEMISTTSPLLSEDEAELPSPPLLRVSSQEVRGWRAKFLHHQLLLRPSKVLWNESWDSAYLTLPWHTAYNSGCNNYLRILLIIMIIKTLTLIAYYVPGFFPHTFKSKAYYCYCYFTPTLNTKDQKSHETCPSLHN